MQRLPVPLRIVIISIIIYLLLGPGWDRFEVWLLSSDDPARCTRLIQTLEAALPAGTPADEVVRILEQHDLEVVRSPRHGVINGSSEWVKVGPVMRRRCYVIVNVDSKNNLSTFTVRTEYSAPVP